MISTGRYTRQILMPALITALFLATGCSWNNPFVIVNGSSSTVTVEYQFGIEPATVNLPHPVRAFEVPVMKSEDDVGDWDAPWQRVPANRMETDQDHGSVRVILGPGEALRVRNIRGYSVAEKWDQAVLLEDVKITSPSGAVRYSGDQLRTRFLKHGQFYILRFP